MDNIQRNAHRHTFALTISMEKKTNGTHMVTFGDLDELTRRYLAQYNGAYLNGLTQFQGVYPSVEWMAEVFFDDLEIIFRENGWNCLQLEVFDNPLNVCIVSNQILLPSENPEKMTQLSVRVLEEGKKYRSMLNRLMEENW
jgi:6-pyruvoyl-tetrahydropterin synthase